jgi:hypothetical protein
METKPVERADIPANNDGRRMLRIALIVLAVIEALALVPVIIHFARR